MHAWARYVVLQDIIARYFAPMRTCSQGPPLPGGWRRPLREFQWSIELEPGVLLHLTSIQGPAGAERNTACITKVTPTPMMTIEECEVCYLTENTGILWDDSIQDIEKAGETFTHGPR